MCDALQAADCWACANSACSCRISVVRNGEALLGGLAQDRNVEDRGGPFDLHDAPVQRHLAIEGGRAADDAVAADHGSLDHLPVTQTDDQRDHAAMREIDPVDGIAGIEEQVALHHLEWLQVRTQQLEIRCRQRRQQTIGMLNRSHRAFRMQQAERDRLSAPDASEPVGAAAGHRRVIRIGFAPNECRSTHGDANRFKNFSGDMFATEPTVCGKST